MGIYLKDINLKGKTALITGATGGIGKSLIKKFTQITNNKK